tara:strand:+ start:309 stop:530 length:222 start_codon:yes stop_codon:yes gene_type:complete
MFYVCLSNLNCKKLQFLIRERELFLSNIREQVAALKQLHHEEDMRASLEGVVQLTAVRIAYTHLPKRERKKKN